MSSSASSSSTTPSSGSSWKKNRGKVFLWGVGGLLACALVVLVWMGVSNYSSNPPAYGTQQAAYAPAAVAKTSPLAAQCDYSNRRKELVGSEVFVFNEGARCITNFTVAEGPIEFDGPNGKVTLETREKLDLSQVWLESARAVNGHAVLLYQLVE